MDQNQLMMLLMLASSHAGFNAVYVMCLVHLVPIIYNYIKTKTVKKLATMSITKATSVSGIISNHDVYAAVGTFLNKA